MRLTYLTYTSIKSPLEIVRLATNKWLELAKVENLVTGVIKWVKISKDYILCKKRKRLSALLFVVLSLSNRITYRKVVSSTRIMIL